MTIIGSALLLQLVRDDTENMSEKIYFVYIMASRPNGALYIGVTADLITRVGEHKTGVGSKHVNKYDIHTLVYYEIFDEAGQAIQREKQLKKWRRQWKIDLVETDNPQWHDLFESLL